MGIFAHGRTAARLLRATSLLAAVALFTTTAFSSVALAVAAEPTTPPVESASASEQPSTAVTATTEAPALTPDELPAGATEIASKRSRFATHYQLPDGRKLAMISASPVNYRTPSGAFAPIETTMRPFAPGRAASGANSFQVSAGSIAPSGTVVLASDGFSVSMDPILPAGVAPIVTGSRDLSHRWLHGPRL